MSTKLSADEARRLLAQVREKLASYGAADDDDVLPEYVIVMVQNGKRQEQIANEMEAFMGGWVGGWMDGQTDRTEA